MNPWLTFVLSSFATFRIAHALTIEEGPLSAFSIMRRQVPAKTNPGRGIRCFNCVSVYVAAAATGYLVWHGFIAPEMSPIYWLGFSGAAIAINRVGKD